MRSTYKTPEVVLGINVLLFMTIIYGGSYIDNCTLFGFDNDDNEGLKNFPSQRPFGKGTNPCASKVPLLKMEYCTQTTVGGDK